MKKIYSFILVMSVTGLFSQAPFWTENFGTDPGACSSKSVQASGLVLPSGTWTVTNTGFNDIYPNIWFVSAAEAGMGVGACGNGCGSTPSLTNKTLHIGWNFISFIDDGASYLSGTNTFTDKRAESPVINCTGKSNITLSFLYLMAGHPGTDYMDVQYSSNGGSTWTVITTPAPTPTAGCSPQGKWTSYTVSLPSSANNNSNVKIGFRWQNTSSSPTNPSVAIDDLALTEAVVPTPTLSPTFAISTPLCTNQTRTLTAVTGTFSISGYTWTASPSGPVLGSPNASVTSITFPAAGTFSVTLTVTSGTTTASETHTTLAQVCTGINSLTLDDNSYNMFPNPTSDKLFIQANYSSDMNVVVVDALGKTVIDQKPNFNSDNSTYTVNVSSIPEGIYFIKIYSGSKEIKVKKFVKQ